MDTLQDVLDFARSSAQFALNAYPGEYDNPIAAHRQNIRDTLAEHNLSQFENEAFCLFDEITRAPFSVYVVRAVELPIGRAKFRREYGRGIASRWFN